MTKPVELASIAARLQSAVRTVIDADAQNPATRLTPSDVRANPYRRAPGDDGAVDKNEAKRIADPFARSVFEAASLQEGQNILVGGSTGFREDILPAFRVDRGEVRKLADHVEMIARRLDGDGDGKLTADELGRVEAEIDAFYAELYPARSQPRSQFKEKVAQLIREAFALEQSVEP